MAIKGSLKEASLPDVIQLLYLGRRTGCLAITDRQNLGYIYFDDGKIAYASIVNRRRQQDREGARTDRQPRLQHRLKLVEEPRLPHHRRFVGDQRPVALQHRRAVERKVALISRPAGRDKQRAMCAHRTAQCASWAVRRPRDP